MENNENPEKHTEGIAEVEDKAKFGEWMIVKKKKKQET